MQMEVSILVTFSIMKYLAEGDTNGQMERHMMDSGTKTKCMVTELLYGKMVKSMRVIS